MFNSSIILLDNNKQIKINDDDKTGFLYCMTNEMFDKDVYKIGRTKDTIKRKKNYTTPYIKEIEYLYVSKRLINCKIGEKVLHYLLEKYRINEDREFFKININTIIENIKFIENLEHDILNYYYVKIIQGLKPIININNINELTNIMNNLQISKDLETFFDKFKFRPKDPSFYYNFKKSYQYNDYIFD